MAGSREAAEVEADYLEAMGPELGSIYYSLYKEVVWIHARWLEYRKLFAERENVQLLNRHGSFVFRLIQDALWDETLLHITRLTDPPRTGRNENLSILRLPDLIEDEALRTEISELATMVLERSEFAREHRNKRLSHLDLSHAAAPSSEPLSGISREYVENALQALRNLMNRLEQVYRDTTVGFEYFLSINDANFLLNTLRSHESDDAL